jgi:hypothetical protein
VGCLKDGCVVGKIIAGWYYERVVVVGSGLGGILEE